MPALAPSPARNALVGALLTHGIASSLGAASSPRPDFGRELTRPRLQAGRTARHPLRARGAGRRWAPAGRNGPGPRRRLAKFSILVTTTQTEAELAALHRAGALRVEGNLTTVPAGADVVPIRGVILGGAT